MIKVVIKLPRVSVAVMLLQLWTEGNVHIYSQGYTVKYNFTARDSCLMDTVQEDEPPGLPLQHRTSVIIHQSVVCFHITCVPLPWFLKEDLVSPQCGADPPVFTGIMIQFDLGLKIMNI